MAFSARSFFFVIIVPLAGDDEPKISLIQTPQSVQLPLTAHSFCWLPIADVAF
jgi:hypothetical protein